MRRPNGRRNTTSNPRLVITTVTAASVPPRKAGDPRHLKRTPSKTHDGARLQERRLCQAWFLARISWISSFLFRVTSSFPLHDNDLYWLPFRTFKWLRIRLDFSRPGPLTALTLLYPPAAVLQLGPLPPTAPSLHTGLRTFVLCSSSFLACELIYCHPP